MARKKSSPTSCCVTGKVLASASTSETTTLLRWTARRRSGSLWFQVTRPLGTTCAGSSRACAQVCCAVIGLPSVLRTAGLTAFGTAGRRSCRGLMRRCVTGLFSWAGLGVFRRCVGGGHQSLFGRARFAQQDLEGGQVVVAFDQGRLRAGDGQGGFVQRPDPFGHRGTVGVD